LASADEPVRINAAKDYTPEEIAAVLKSGSGISGPGKPVAGDGVLSKLGVDTTVTQENREKVASASVVKSGLLPPIKPIWDVHMRDTNIILGGDGNYYMTGSTGDNIWRYNDGIELWKSLDLKTWSYLGLIWSVEKDGGWEKFWRELHGKPVRSVWAPEIHYIHGNYYLTFGMPPGGISILKSTTGKPEGPYVHATDPNRPLVGGIGPTSQSFLIDPTLFEDDDGKVYFTYGPGEVIARMKVDLSDFAETPRRVVLSDKVYDPATRRDARDDFGFEGATIFKANGKYYFGSTDKYHGRYSMCMGISNNIYGPYRLRHETVPCNGGTNFFKGKDGFWYTSLFGDDNQAPWREKPGIVRIDFDKDGKVVVARTQPDFILIKSATNTAVTPRFLLNWDSISSRYTAPGRSRDAKFGGFNDCVYDFRMVSYP
jgi:GH43 family beta-xylosidase